MDSGTCGENATWKLTGTGTGYIFNISGKGAVTSKNGFGWTSRIGDVEEVVIEEGITSIEKICKDALKLTKVTLPEGLIAIGEESFYGCKVLPEIKIPDSVENIGRVAFFGCNSFRKIDLPKNLKHLDNQVFGCCRYLKMPKLPEGLQTIGIGALSIGEYLPDSTATELFIPASVTFIDDGAFGLSNTTSFVVDEDNKFYSSENGCLYSKDKETLLQVPKVHEYDKLYLNAKTRTIYDSALNSCRINVLVFPEGFKKLKQWRIDLVVWLNNLYINSVYLPASIEIIEEGNFGEYATGLEDIYYAGSKEQWEAIDLQDPYALTKRIHYNADVDKIGYISPNEIVLSENEASLQVGDEMNLSAMIKPQDADVNTVSWKVEPADVVSLSADKSVSGEEITLTAIAPGTATITAVADDNPAISATATINVTAKEIRFMLKLDANGGTAGFDQIEMVNEQVYPKLPEAKRTGYVFDGWYNAKDGGEEVVAGAQLLSLEAHTLYAHWSPISYKVMFSPNGGRGSMTSIDCVYDKSYSFPDNGFSAATGYEFKNWNTKQDGSGTTYTAGDTFTNLTTKNDEVITIYAQWTRTGIIVTLDPNGGSVDEPEIAAVLMYSELPNPTKEGYSFKGWYSSRTGGKKVSAGKTVLSMSDHTLYAHWTPIKYIVRFNANGGTGKMKNISCTYDKARKLTKNTLKKKGYKFVGWYSNKKLTNKYSFKKSVTKNLILYAKWKKAK